MARREWRGPTATGPAMTSTSAAKSCPSSNARDGLSIRRLRSEIKLTRPGKNPGEGISATFGHKGRRIFHVFTSSAPPFEANRGYAPFTVYALLEHGGDFAAAASDLRRQGFGSGDSDQRTNQLDKGTTPDNGAGQPEEDNSMDAQTQA